jgi:CheY-like chemotaxis protein
MGGEIGLSSSPRGSTFWFTLPLGAPAPAIDVTGQASARLGARVLVADDDPVNQRVASLHLERLGYEVDTVPDGAAAVRAVAVAEAVRPYDAVLMDCHMPGIDGYESTRRIRRNEAAGRHVPIIALTASTTDTDRCMALEAGMDDHLVKPVRASALEGALARWVVVAVETRDGDRAVEPDAAARPVAAEADADEADAEGQAALDGIVALAAGQPGLIEELLSTLRTEAAQRLTALRTAVSRSDVDSVAENAHRLRGTAANIGATRVVACARALETAAARGDFMTAAVVLEVLPGLLDEAEARLRSALGSPVA